MMCGMPEQRPILQVSLPAPQQGQASGATLQQLRAIAQELHPKLQAAMQQAVCRANWPSGAQVHDVTQPAKLMLAQSQETTMLVKAARTSGEQTHGRCNFAA